MTCQDTCKCKDYDVVIIGAGPAGLATLSALQESFSLDTLTEQQRHQVFVGGTPTKKKGSLSKKTTSLASSKQDSVAVIDPSGDWLTSWKDNFSKLDIQFLRSPALAHPDAFDETALVAYAVSQGRQDELQASGCSDVTRLRGLEEAYSGLWNMPSTHLFIDFCRDTAKALPHDFYSNAVSTVKPIVGKKKNELSYSILLNGAQKEELTARTVVLAMGALGDPVIPKGVANVPPSRLMHWKSLHSNHKNSDKKKGSGIPSDWKDILVVGGGLTAVQVAQLALKSGDTNRRATLCSRRPLMEQHLDIGLEWADRRLSRKCQSDFYHQPLQARLAMLKQARGGGGSVPPCYMREVEALESQGRLKRLVGNPNYVCSEEEKHPHPNTAKDNVVKCEGCNLAACSAPLPIRIGSTIHRFDGVLVACGVRPDCRANPVCESILSSNYFVKELSGFPIVSEDLEWMSNVFVVGGMASLNLGPDAGNLMGMRRAATIVATALGCRSWLRDEGNVLANRFSLFEDDSSTSSSSSEEQSEDEDSDEEDVFHGAN